MHPTVDEQLAGAGRLLDLAAADTGLSPDSAQALANARRLLVQVQRSWANLLAFYSADNAALAALIGRLARVAGQTRGIDEAPPDDLDVVAAAEHNAALRERLSRLLAALPDSSAGTDARAEIATYLSARVAADPS